MFGLFRPERAQRLGGEQRPVVTRRAAPTGTRVKLFDSHEPGVMCQSGARWASSAWEALSLV